MTEEEKKLVKGGFYNIFDGPNIPISNFNEEFPVLSNDYLKILKNKCGDKIIDPRLKKMLEGLKEENNE